MFGIPEVLVILAILTMWLVPIAAAVWALLMLSRTRAGQEELARKVDALASRMS